MQPVFRHQTRTSGSPLAPTSSSMQVENIRAPQSTAIVVGKQKLCQAIWWIGAAHQAFGRSVKVGKEEMVGALVALDRWINSQSAEDERARWLPRLRLIERYLSPLPGVATKIMSGSGPVTAVRLKISWDGGRIPFDAEALRLALLEQRPRILIDDFWPTPTSIILDPVNLRDDEAEVVARALALAFTSPQSISWPIDLQKGWSLTSRASGGSKCSSSTARPRITWRSFRKVAR